MNSFFAFFNRCNSVILKNPSEGMSNQSLNKFIFQYDR